jgi:Ni/Co efflux regulator RcnB
MKRFLMLMTMTAVFAWAMALPAMAQEQGGEKSGQTAEEKAKKGSESVAEKASRAAARGVRKGVDATKKGVKTGVAAVEGTVEGTKKGTKEGYTGGKPAGGAAAINTLTPAEESEGWELLFNGKDLTGFRGFKSASPTTSWKVADGAITYVGEGTDLVTDQQFGDFELEFDWRIAPGGNSGVMYQVTEEGDETYWSGPEYQILDNARHPDAKQGVNGNRTAGACYDLYAPSTDASKPAGEWNSSKIVMKGNHVEHWLNGQKVVEYERGSADWNKRLAASKFTEWPMFAKSSTGHIVFQDHGDDVWYRSIKVHELK